MCRVDGPGPWALVFWFLLLLSLFLGEVSMSSSLSVAACCGLICSLSQYALA